MFIRSVFALVLLPALVASASAQTSKQAETSAPPKVQDAAASTKSVEAKVKEPSKPKELTYAEEYNREMKSCMDAWDAGTNMTKAKWREICQRTLKERLPYRRASRGGAPQQK